MTTFEAANPHALHEQLQRFAVLDDAPAATVELWSRHAGRLSHSLETKDVRMHREFHETLHLLLSVHQALPYTWAARQSASHVALRIRQQLFSALLEHEQRKLLAMDIPPIPTRPEALVDYLIQLNAQHVASRHPVFDYLQEAGSLRDVKSFFYQEGSVDARFDDLIAIAQVGTDGSIKDEYAHNFADEMGHGNPERVHTTMFLRTAEYIHSYQGEDPQVLREPITEALACSNLQIGMALHREHVFRMAGYLAAFELNATDRCRRLVKACVRHGMDVHQLEYLTEHIDADVGHAEGLFHEILVPMATLHERAPVEIVQGFLLRLQTSSDYCETLLKQFLQD
ncbi:iron-containing redox enzyme family protein [Ferroacidibacillus organovorans]|uniref:Iron-containing redox enzyme family protein n=1 Tax=Ferroacidibacillus organovorans TaxID=1765683 RepID=A0A101XRQ8_9BACL|nr:iron-containing redox enzyme family protein [Ferroacidibacillus organovorans]KUO96313.1 hypothetical protein ATW55_03640 [Ferroacidibacillus organovorans]